MPRETYRVSVPLNTDLQTLQRFATEINDALEAIARREAALEGRDGTTATLQSNLQMNSHRICGVGRSQQDDEAVPRSELVEKALYARRGRHVAQFPIQAKRLIIQETTSRDSAVPLSQIQAIAQESSIGTASDTEILYNNSGQVDGVPNLTWDGAILLLTAPLELDDDLDHDGANVGFFGTAPTTKPAATVDIIDALVSLGLHTAGAPVGYYAEIYGHSTATTITISGTGEANKAQVTAFAVDGESNGATPDFTNDHITIDTAGKYLITLSMSVESAGSGAYSISISVFKNNGATELENIHGDHDFGVGGGGDEATLALHGIADLAVNDTIEVWVWNNTDTNDIVVNDVTLSLVRVGS